MGKGKSLLSVLLIAASVLCGCGNGAVPKDKGVQSDVPMQESGGTSGTEESSGAEEKTPDIQETVPYVQPEMKGEITISCLFAEEFLNTAAEQFMKQYPDVKVTVNSYKESSGESAVEDYRTYLNTKIMTGKAEDILFTGFLPITRYSEMGVFEDLSGYIQKTPELNDENYFMNVLQAAKEDGGEIYIVPYMARFDTLAFSAELMSEHRGNENDMQGICFGTAMDLAKQLVDETDKSNVFLIQINEVFYTHYLIKDSVGQFIDGSAKNVNLDSPEYVALLESVKALAEKGYFGSDIDFYNMEYYFAAECDYDVQAAYYSMDTKNGVNHCMPLTDAEGRTLIKSNSCVAINSASENKDLSWEFIRYLLSDQVQTSPSFHGPTVSRKGLEAVAERYYALYQEGNGGAGFGSEAEYKAVLKSWMEQINGCDTLDAAVMDLVDEENSKYFSGQQTAEETARRLKRQLEQYFNE